MGKFFPLEKLNFTKGRSRQRNIDGVDKENFPNLSTFAYKTIYDLIVIMETLFHSLSKLIIILLQELKARAKSKSFENH